MEQGRCRSVIEMQLFLGDVDLRLCTPYAEFTDKLRDLHHALGKRSQDEDAEVIGASLGCSLRVLCLVNRPPTP